MTTVREATFDFLRRQGMTTVFGNPGSTELPFLEQFPDDFRYVLGLHEGVAVGVADGYAQASGRPALVNLHTAPGVGNGMGAMFNAQSNKSPLVITAGQQARSLMTLQALLTNRDAARMPHPLVKWSYEPPRAEDVPHAIARATHLAALPPRGPVFVSIPMDDWRAEVDEDATGHQLGREVSGRAGADPERVAELARRLAAASNPVLVVGPDADASGAWDAAVELAERARLPVWAPPATGGGRIGFPEDHAHFRGVLPPAVGPLADTLAGHDLILVVGSSVFAYYPNIPGSLLPDGASLVAITSDPDEAARAPMGDAIVADVKLTLEALLAHVEAPDRPAPEPRAGGRAARGRRSDDRLGRHRRARRRVAGRGRDGARVARQHASRSATACGSRGPARTTSPPAAGSASRSRPRSACRWRSRTGAWCACSARARRSTRSRGCGPRPPTTCRSRS